MWLQNWPEEQEDAPVEFRYMCGDVDHSGALIEAGVTEADAIIIGPAEDLPDNEVHMWMLLVHVHALVHGLDTLALYCLAFDLLVRSVWIRGQQAGTNLVLSVAKHACHRSAVCLCLTGHII